MSEIQSPLLAPAHDLGNANDSSDAHHPHAFSGGRGAPGYGSSTGEPRWGEEDAEDDRLGGGGGIGTFGDGGSGGGGRSPPPGHGETFDTVDTFGIDNVGTTPAGGLSYRAAAAALRHYDANDLPAPRPDRAARLVLQLRTPTACVIWLAIALQCAQNVSHDTAGGGWVDLAALLALQALNAVVGCAEESRAAAVVAATQGTIERRAVVTRGGATTSIDARELVPGDLIVVSAGASVPADCRLTEAGTCPSH